MMKRLYHEPKVTKVALRADEAVLNGCKHCGEPYAEGPSKPHCGFGLEGPCSAWGS